MFIYLQATKRDFSSEFSATDHNPELPSEPEAEPRAPSSLRTESRKLPERPLPGQSLTTCRSSLLHL